MEDMLAGAVRANRVDEDAKVYSREDLERAMKQGAAEAEAYMQVRRDQDRDMFNHRMDQMTASANGRFAELNSRLQRLERISDATYREEQQQRSSDRRENIGVAIDEWGNRVPNTTQQPDPSSRLR